MQVTVLNTYEDAFEHIECSLDEQYPDGKYVHEFECTDLWGLDPSLIIEINESLYN